MNVSPEILYVVGAVVLAAALIYATTRRRSRSTAALNEAGTRQVYREEERKEARELASEAAVPASRDAPSLRMDHGSERQTEDEMARASLGGTRGSPDLPDAPMTGAREKKNPQPFADRGHTA